jgi:hypothetical protein
VHGLQLQPSRYLPALHGVQVVLADCLPEGHFLQFIAPLSSWYFPVLHGLQVPLMPALPMVQSLHVMLPLL